MLPATDDPGFRYRGFSYEELVLQYNPQVAVPDHASWKWHWALLSRRARARLHGVYDLPYGPTPGQTFDVFKAARPGAPINVFTHGGFWRFLDKSDHTFVAEPFVERGATFVLLNYDLCPKVSLPEQVEQVRRGVAWVYEHAAELNGDREQLYVSGHSAGGHLTSMIVAEGALSPYGVPANAIKGATAVSGFCDLDPILLIPGGEELRLDPDTARRFSPLFCPPEPTSDMIIAVGELETTEWLRQFDEYVTVCERRGCAVKSLKMQLDNHYSILLSMANSESDLCRAMLSQMKLT